jgi:DNA polymerase III sliding clamp (beta) subunit (PCNA family)
MIKVSSARAGPPSVEETLEASYAGGVVSVVVNPGFVADALQAISASLVEVRVSGEVEPVTLSAPAEPGFTAVIMPIRM